MLKTSEMAYKNTDINRRHRDGVVNNLRDLFGSVLHIDIIRSVASECEFDVQRSSNVLLEMTNNIEEQPFKKKEKAKKRSPQQTPPLKMPPAPRAQTVKSRKTLEIERVIANIRNGYKVLVLLRGLPGSGKSRMAASITDVTLGPGNNSHHILSTDDFFIQRGGYVFDPSKLHEAHEWNQQRAFRAMSRGLSPVLIDNTNTQMWEMKPYAMMATDYGYIIDILEPDTWWAFNDKELARRNTHNVPRGKIQDMLQRYDKNVSTQKLLVGYNLTYKFQKPPQYRLLPPVSNGFAQFNLPPNAFVVEKVPKSKSVSDLDEAVNLMEFSEVSNGCTKNNDNQNVYVNPVDEILMCTEENQVDVLQPDPVGTPSSVKSESALFPDIENAWGISEKALHSWDIVTPIQCDSNGASIEMTSNQEEETLETRDNSTCIEASDFLKDDSEIPFGFRVVVAHNRDINFGLGSPVKTSAPPKKIMVDQSSTTEDFDLEDDEQNRVKDLMDLFPKVSRSALQELYLKCHKNFHWTVDLLLEDNNLEAGDEALQEEHEETPDPSPTLEEEPKEEKVFKRKTISEDSLELKKCLESKFDINKEHYSEHVYKVKQSKYGGPSDPQPSTSTDVNLDSDSDTDDDVSSQSDENPKNMIEINLGETFVDQLETMFGGNDGTFPKGFQPVVQMPVSLARQIYSFYIESICQQMEAQNHILDRLVKEDEEFARKLQQEEAPVATPQVPNLSEIMDEQVALNLHKKDVDEWKNLTADNLAAKLTKQKLFEAFPNVDRDALLEIWHAYDYDYNKTVEVLIASVGADHVNGSGETIREPPLSQTTIQEMKDAEEDCDNGMEPEEQKPATYYREKANMHLNKRAELYERAKSYYIRGMTEVAMFYSELAKKETQYYDRANHFAAVAFIEEHSNRLQKFDTLDLHYLYVKEAIPNLDMFIDRNINLLKGSNKRGQDLFVITGRGKNSEGGISKIKPAVIGRLKKRQIGFVPLNPGLLKIRVQKDSMVTSDIP